MWTMALPDGKLSFAKQGDSFSSELNMSTMLLFISHPIPPYQLVEMPMPLDKANHTVEQPLYLNLNKTVMCILQPQQSKV